MIRRRKQKAPLPIGEVLQRALKRREIFVPRRDPTLEEIWAKAVGPQIASRTCPDSLKRGTLYVKVSTSVWMQELQFMKKDILHKVASLLGQDAVRGIRFSIGEIQPAAEKKAENETLDLDERDLTHRDRRVIAGSLDAVGDPELREILKRTMTKEILRSKILRNPKGR